MLEQNMQRTYGKRMKKKHYLLLVSSSFANSTHVCLGGHPFVLWTRSCTTWEVWNPIIWETISYPQTNGLICPVGWSGRLPSSFQLGSTSMCVKGITGVPWSWQLPFFPTFTLPEVFGPKNHLNLCIQKFERPTKKETSTHNLWGPSVWPPPPFSLTAHEKRSKNVAKKVARTPGGRASSCSQWWCNQAVSWHLTGAGQDGNGQMMKVSPKRGWFFLKPIDLAGLIFLLG